MWDKVRKWLAAALAVLVVAAAGVGYALRRRAASAGRALESGRVEDAEQRGREEEARARLQVIEDELAKPEPVPAKRTAAQILEEQRRRGQLIE